MSKNNTYNGWRNYETWNVALWLGNEEGLYRAMREQAEAQRFNAETMRGFVLDMMPNGTPDFDDMGGAKAYDRVHWTAIARMANER